ncbi:MAG: polymer-forming cytoskeletal protein [Phycisphaeraceae bacterium]|nr:polymer-forming cytoskeletal protein [Phycisphaeraceae bacterium]
MAETGETTVVGADSHFKGELTFERTAKIIGRFDGKISGNGILNVAPNAQCKADVTASGVQVDGNIEGNVACKDTVKLNGSGVVRGDITAAKMVMAEGAAFYGMCNVGPESSKQPAGRGGSPAQGGAPGASTSGGGGEQSRK